MDVKDYWREVYQRFDPEATPNRVEWRVERPYSPATEVIRKLRVGLSQPRILLVGTRGTGKTTELYRVVDALGPSDLAIYLDVHLHLQDRVADAAAIDRLRPWEVVQLVALATLRAGRELLGVDALAEPERMLSRAIQAFHPGAGPELDAGKLASGLAVGVSSLAAGHVPGLVAGGLQLLTAAAAAGSWRLPIGRRTSEADDQDERVRRLIEATNRLIQDIQSVGRRPVFLLDGLDRIQDASAATELFVRSSLLGQLAFRAMVVVAPVSLRRGQLARIRGFSSTVVHEVPVLLRDDPTRDGPGIDFFREVWRRRTHDLGSAGMPDALLRRAARYSGGRPRSFQRIVRDTAEQAYGAGLPTATDELLDRVLRELRLELEEGITREDVSFLQGVMRDPLLLVDDRDKQTDLLERLLLFPYPNDDTWYYPNPLLFLGRLLGSSASSASSISPGSAGS